MTKNEKKENNSAFDVIETLKNSETASVLIEDIDTLKALDNSTIGKELFEAVLDYVRNSNKLYVKKIAKATGEARSALQKLIKISKEERRNLQEEKNKIKEARKSQKGTETKPTPKKADQPKQGK